MEEAEPYLIISKLISTIVAFCGVLLYTFNVMANYNLNNKYVYFKIGLFLATFPMPILLGKIKGFDAQLNEIFM